MKLTKLNDKIKYIKRAFKTPYHFFFMTSNKQVTVIFEDKYGERYTFTGDTIFNSVETAEEYVRHEIEAGAINEPKQIVKDKKDNEEKEENENN